MTPSPRPHVPVELAAVVRAGVRAAREVPGAVALGGTVCSLYASHRLSYDIDFVISDFVGRYDAVREHLETVPGWKTVRTTPPVLILGSLDGVPIGYRQLRRTVPLETVTVETAEGPLVVPTFVELLRIKAFLACERNTTRDFLDFAELATLAPRPDVVDALVKLDEKMGWEQRPEVALEVAKALATCEPRDAASVGYGDFRFLRPRVHSWDESAKICKEVAADLTKRLLGTSQ